VLTLVLGVGGLGLWLLRGAEFTVKNSDADKSTAVSGAKSEDVFSDFGGKTPEKTLLLLIVALEKNNLTLAAKYFAPELRTSQSEDLEKLRKAKLIADLVKSLKSIKTGKNIDGSHYQFEVPGETGGETVIEIELIKNSAGLWKIISL